MITAVVCGNIGKDAELRDAGNDRVCSFSVASTEKRKTGEVTTWVRASLWGARGEKLVSHLRKGTKVVLSGSLSTREYEGKLYVELRVSELEFAGGKASGESRPAAKPQKYTVQEPSEDASEDLGDCPF